MLRGQLLLLANNNVGNEKVHVEVVKLRKSHTEHKIFLPTAMHSAIFPDIFKVFPNSFTLFPNYFQMFPNISEVFPNITEYFQIFPQYFHSISKPINKIRSAIWTAIDGYFMPSCILNLFSWSGKGKCFKMMDLTLFSTHTPSSDIYMSQTSVFEALIFLFHILENHSIIYEILWTLTRNIQQFNLNLIKFGRNCTLYILALFFTECLCLDHFPWIQWNK